MSYRNEEEYDEGSYVDEGDDGDGNSTSKEQAEKKPATMREMLMRFGAIGNFGFQCVAVFLIPGMGRYPGKFSGLSTSGQVARGMSYGTCGLGAAHSPVVIYKERQLTQEDTFRTALNGIREEQGRLAEQNDILSGEIDELQSEVDRMKDVEEALRGLASTQGTQLDELMGLIEENKEINRCLRIVLKNKCVEDVITLVLDIDNDGSFTIQNKEIDRLLIGMTLIDEISSIDERMVRQKIVNCGGDVDKVIGMIKKMIHGEGGNEGEGDGRESMISVGDPEEYLNKHRTSTLP